MFQLLSALESNKTWVMCKEYCYLVLGALTLAAGVVLFLSPNQVATGSTTGLAIVLHHLWDIPIGVLIALVNLPLLGLGWKSLGRRFTLRTILSVMLASLFVNLLSQWSSLGALTDDLFLAAIYGGLLIGIGAGLTYKGEASAGGGGIVAKIVSERSFLQTGQVLFMIDVVVISFSGIVFQNIELALYAGVSVFVTGRTVDMVLTGTPFAKSVYITTRCRDAIVPAIRDSLDLPMTVMQATGAEPGSQTHVISVVANARQIMKINEIVELHDPKALTVVSDASDIIGHNG